MGDDGKIGGEAEANAAFIVRACNNHDRLVKALKCASCNLALAQRETDLGPYGRLALTAIETALAETEVKP